MSRQDILCSAWGDLKNLSNRYLAGPYLGGGGGGGGRGALCESIPYTPYALCTGGVRVGLLLNQLALV